MSDSVTTRLDVPYGQQPETRAAAVRTLERLGALDLVAVLGLDDGAATEPGPIPTGVNHGDGTLRCSECRQRTRGDGICRRKTECGTPS